MRNTGLAVLLFVVACGAPPPQHEESSAPTRDVAADYQLRVLRVNGIEMRVAEQGDGPLVLLLHGAPESWYSWRHQLPALANAGFRVVAPDMRGYGGTEAPPAVEDYAIDRLCGDVTGLIDAYGEEQAVLIGHDWGAAVAWQCTLIAEERVRAVVVLSKIGSWLASTSRHQTPQPPTEVLRQAYGRGQASLGW